MTVRIIAGVAALLAAIAALLAARMKPAAEMVAVTAPDITEATRQAAQTLSEALRLRTISERDGAEQDASAFTAFHDLLQDRFPAAHGAMTREIVNDYSLLFHWRSAREDGAAPVALLAHMDVVPVEAGTQDAWTYPPFAGAIGNGAVWGRGALDDKGQIIAIMAAIEGLAEAGFRPTRNIYFLFGHDEEIGGENGAAAMAAQLKKRGVQLAFTLDEGSGVISGVIPGVAAPIALISTAEKGYATLELTARGTGGHSSTPPKETAIATLAAAVTAVSDNPFPGEIDEDVTALLHAIAPQRPFLERMVLSNLWLTAPLVRRQFDANALTAAALRTTTAPTVIDGGEKDNILPQSASATINFRIHPRDNVEIVRERTARLIDDERIEIALVEGRDPSPRATTDADGFAAIAAATRAVYGDIEITPSLTLAATDSRHYTDVAENNYRFTPMIFGPDDMSRIHGDDERIKLIDLQRMIDWYTVFLAGLGE